MSAFPLLKTYDLRCVPHIKITGSKDNVCKKYEDCIKQISLARSEDEKLERTNDYHAHVLAARNERCISLIQEMRG